MLSVIRLRDSQSTNPLSDRHSAFLVDGDGDEFPDSLQRERLSVFLCLTYPRREPRILHYDQSPGPEVLANRHPWISAVASYLWVYRTS